MQKIRAALNQYGLGIILLLATLLRIFQLGKRDFWYDEAFTGIAIKESFWGMMRMTINDVHPPLYYLLLKPFASLFGYSIPGIRLFSVIFGILGVWAIYLFAKEYLGKRAALFASFLVAVSPFAIQYSREGRMYALFVFLITLAGYFLVRAIRTEKLHFHLFWGFCMGLAWLTHYMGIVYSPIIFFFALSEKLFTGAPWDVRSKKFWQALLPSRGILLGYAAMFLTFGFWMKQFVYHVRFSGVNNMLWVKPASFGDIFSNVQMFLFGTPQGEMSAGMPSPNGFSWFAQNSILVGIVVLLTICLLSLWRINHRKTTGLLILSFGFLGIVYTMSLTGNDYFVSRYVLPAAYFLFVFLGYWLSTLPKRTVAFILIAYAVLIMNIKPIGYSQGWGEFMQHSREYQGKHFYILNSFDYVLAKYYLGADRVTLYNIDWPQYNPDYWAAIGNTLRRTESLDSFYTDPNALIIANIQVERDKRNDKTFEPNNFSLVGQYRNITVYRAK